jgi:hypothetical protein
MYINNGLIRFFTYLFNFLQMQIWSQHRVIAIRNTHMTHFTESLDISFCYFQLSVFPEDGEFKCARPIDPGIVQQIISTPFFRRYFLLWESSILASLPCNHPVV